tara:strand:- start:76010 stop:77905 length:1896 start_codon:yes stop_codon:yes gene_type:complete
MTKRKLTIKKTKEIVTENYHGKMFEKHELPSLLENFKKITKDIYDEDNIKKKLKNYLHYSKKYNRYSFNIKKVNKDTESISFESRIVNTINFDDEESYSDEYLEYKFPENESFICNKNKFGPFGTQWVHDKQYDDNWDEELEKRAKQFDFLRAIELPEQRTPEWFRMREGKITASDGGVVLGKNKYEPEYKFILKKTIGAPFNSNKFCYHGKKLEEPATMVYAYRMNVRVDEFGLMGHPTIPFLGASPDGICNKFKYDKKHRSKYVGRMLEIKCPLSRFTWQKEGLPITDLDNPGNKEVICPSYYWIQVQLQLECCDLEECDFWQCKIGEYDSKKEFIEDTDPKEPFRSKTYKQEKGCLIQLLPYSSIPKIRQGDYWNEVYDKAIFIYPTEIEMTPNDCDKWVEKTLAKYWLDGKYDRKDKPRKYRDYYFDKVIYWRMEDTKNVTLNRDREWFKQNYPKFEKMWKYVEKLREDREALNTLVRFVNSRTYKRNVEIMNVIDRLCNKDKPDYKKWYDDLIKNIEEIEVRDEDQHEHIDKDREQNIKKSNYESKLLSLSKFFDDDKDKVDLIIKKVLDDDKYSELLEFIDSVKNSELEKEEAEVDDIKQKSNKLKEDFDKFEFKDDDDTYGFSD